MSDEKPEPVPVRAQYKRQAQMYLRQIEKYQSIAKPVSEPARDKKNNV